MDALAQPASPISFATFGDLLKYLRRRERLTQLELAIAVGYSEGQISRLETNQRLPDLTALKALFVPALHLEKEPTFTDRLLELAQTARQEDAPAPGVAPYKGLPFFDESDADLFFGRETLTKCLVDRVQTLAQSGPPRLLTVVGASGSGKSSVVRAGLAVALRRLGWEAYVVTPTAQPLKVFQDQPERVSITDPIGVLYLVDQFEEVFTLCRDETTRGAFIEQLLDTANEPAKRTVVLIALRADFYSHCSQYPRLRQAVAAQQEYIGQMTAEELRRAIQEPAKRGGWELEPGLVDLMLRDIGGGGARDPEPGALPLLSHALLATWERRRKRTLTLESYRASGGVHGAIAETAESIFTDQLNQTQQQLARDIFLRLTELGEGTEDTRRRAALTELVPRPELASQSRAVLNTLAEARLVSLGADSAEVAHEALIREWQRLREWLNQDRESLHLHRRLTEAASEWESLGHDPGVLYRGVRLAQTSEFAANNPNALNERERAFLAKSAEQEKEEIREKDERRQRELEQAQKLAEEQHARAEEQNHANKRLRQRAYFLTGAFVLAIVLAGVAAFFGQQANLNLQAAKEQRLEANSQRELAQKASRFSTARELAATALTNLGVDAQRSVLLALQSVKTTQEQDKLVLPEAEDALHRAVLASRAELLIGPVKKPMWAAVYNPDGSEIATRVDGMIQLWDAKTGKQVLQIPFTAGNNTSRWDHVVFNSDGTQLAIVDYDSNDKSHLWASIYDAHSGERVRQTKIPMTVDEWSVSDYSSDLTKVVIGSYQNTAKVWDTRTGELLQTLSGHQASVVSVAFNADGKRIVTANQDGSAKIWNTANGQELLYLCCHRQQINGTAFSPDGIKVATASDDRTIKIWDATTGKELVTLSGPGDQVKNVAFSPDGKQVAGSSFDRTTLVWNSETGDQLYKLAGHTDVVQGVRFSPDGKHLVTASWDGSAVVWDAGPSHEVAANSTLPIWRSAINQDHTRLATSNAESKFMVWDLVRHQRLLTFTDPSAYPADILANIAISPDGRQVTYSTPNAVKVWDVESRRQMFSLAPKTQADQPSWVGGPLFSADGKHLLGNFDYSQGGQTIRRVLIWDVVSGAQLADFSLPKNEGTYGFIALSPDGSRLVSGDSSGAVRLFDAQTGKELREEHNSGFVDYVLFSPDGKQYVSASLDGTALVRDTETGSTLFPTLTNSATIYSIDYSADGNYIATAGLDGVAKVWDANSGTELHALQGSSAQVRGAHFNADGTHLITTGMDGVIREYALQIDELVELAKARMTRTWAQDECIKFLHVETCPPIP